MEKKVKSTDDEVVLTLKDVILVGGGDDFVIVQGPQDSVTGMVKMVMDTAAIGRVNWKCMCCEHELCLPAQPVAELVLFADRDDIDKIGSLGGICSACDSRPDRDDIILKTIRRRRA